MSIFKVGTLVLLFSLLSCVTTTPTATNGMAVIKQYEGTYTAANSSEGVMKNWKLYSNQVITGDWVTKKNSRTLGIKGHWEYVNDKTIAFEASGDLSIFGVTMARARISGLGELSGNHITGYFILFVDQGEQWADYGDFEATEK